MNALADDPYQVDLDRFQGPLDLLLHLIRNQDIDIFDIPIARVAAQFLHAVRQAESLQLERAGEFLEMAATLVRIKAQTLFPRRDADDPDDPRADLVRRLLEYEHFREAALHLEFAERERRGTYGKGYVEVRPRAPIADAPLQTTWTDVWAAALQLAERLAEPEPGYRLQGRPVRVEDKIGLVLSTLSHAARVEFATLVAPWGTRRHVAASLLACLELAKRHEVRLRQSEPFTPLWVYRHSAEAAAA